MTHRYQVRTFQGKPGFGGLDRFERSGGQNTGTLVGNFYSWVSIQKTIPRLEDQSKGREQIKKRSMQNSRSTRREVPLHQGFRESWIFGGVPPLLYLRRVSHTKR